VARHVTPGAASEHSEEENPRRQTKRPSVSDPSQNGTFVKGGSNSMISFNTEIIQTFADAESEWMDDAKGNAL
jgi:hypothetical protein